MLFEFGGEADTGLKPFVPCAHTQAAVYVIAERAADIIKAAWQ